MLSSSHPSQLLPDMGLLPDLGPKMPLVEGHGGAPLGGQWGSARCMVSAAEQCHPRVGTVMGGRFAAGLEL